MKPGDRITGKKHTYQLIELLVGYGQVYLADTDGENGSTYVIKGFVSSDWFDAEARVHRTITEPHPNLIQYEEIIDKTHVILPYLRGKTLGDTIILKGGFSFDKSLAILSGICAGLEHMHNYGLVHCDVHPWNIMLTPAPVLFDFDCSRSIKTIPLEKDIRFAAAILENMLGSRQVMRNPSLERIIERAKKDSHYQSITTFLHDLQELVQRK